MKQVIVNSPEYPSLVLATGPLAGTRYLLREAITRLGRAADNHLVISGPEASVVSAHHLEVRREGEGWRVCDLNSTNGTFVNHVRVSEAALVPPCSIRLGASGPELLFVLEAGTPADLNQTLTSAPPPPGPLASALSAGVTAEHEQLLAEAVGRARVVRQTGANQTLTIMREVLDTALRRTNNRFQLTVLSLVMMLLGVTGYGWWKIQALTAAKAGIDSKIRQLEVRLEQVGNNPAAAGPLIDSLDQYEGQGQALEQSMFYRLGVRGDADFVTHEIRALMAEFGAEVYSVPPEFTAAVNRFLKQYEGPDRPNMELALGDARPLMDRMRRMFQTNHLPPDLADMVLVESALDNHRRSAAGAAGYWQFTPETAREYGLRISPHDERFDVTKATRAASKYMRDLILDFGAGSSVMLALAAYNVGPAKVKQAIHRLVQDPIKQRNFWYLYRLRALPIETREYVPKVIAAMVIGRHPERFGF